MFKSIFKKQTDKGSATATPHPATPTEATVAQQKIKEPSITAEEIAQWKERIVSLKEDHAALLNFAHEAPSIELKLAALQSLTHEETLKKAMHDFREHDKRLYKAAKAGWETAQAKRMATAQAKTLIDSARILLDQHTAAVNHVVQLDHDWASTQHDLIDKDLLDEFGSLSELLAKKVRAQAEELQSINIWLSKLNAAIEDCSKIINEQAAITSHSFSAEPALTLLHTLIEQTPSTTDDRCLKSIQLAQQHISLGERINTRVNFLEALPEMGTASEDQEKQLINTWNSFDKTAPSRYQHVYQSHQARFQQWLEKNSRTRQDQAESLEQQARTQRIELNAKRKQVLQETIESAEKALAEGHVKDLTQLLTHIDQSLQGGSIHTALMQRIDFLRRELTRLKGWQHWGGGQSREQLAEEAIRLAQLTSGKIDIKLHAEAISNLRSHWKELDKLGGASNQATWLKFDTALKQAYAPIAANIEKRNLAREENLAAREQIVNDLIKANSLLPAKQTEETGSSIDPNWRAVMQVLEQARISWRKLGPTDHTLPKHALNGDDAITTRYTLAFSSLEHPLKDMHEIGIKHRERIITAVNKLGQTDLLARNIIDQIRHLQSQWQATAKTYPLYRHDENKLWTIFKSATDSIFKSRDEARTQSESALQDQLSHRQALLDRFVNIESSTSVTDIKKLLNETEKAWQACQPIPKPLENKLNTRLRDLQRQAQRHIEHLNKSAYQARLNTLHHALTLCIKREALLDATEENHTAHLKELTDQWDALTQLPETWKSALTPRFNATAISTTNLEEPILTTLLKLEAACDIESPSEFIAARQQMKMLELKQALERGQSSTRSAADTEQLLLTVAAYPRLDQQSWARLEKILHALSTHDRDSFK